MKDREVVSIKVNYFSSYYWKKATNTVDKIVSPEADSLYECYAVTNVTF